MNTQKSKVNTTIHLYTKIQKVDDEKRMVYGYCTTESVDSQGEIVSREAIRRAWSAYMEYANVREMHQPSAVGVTKEYQHDDTGTWIGVKVVDNDAWVKVKEGVYKGFSIGGRITLKVDNVIKGIILSEISLVDRPACPDAKISVIKVDDGLVESLCLEEITKNNIMKKYVDIDGVKYVEDPNKEGEPLLDENGEKVVYQEEQEDNGSGDNGAQENADEPKEDEPKPEEPKPTEEPVGGDEGGKSDNPKDTKKDVEGVLTMSGVLDHLAWAKSYFDGRGKSTESLDKAIDAVMAVIKEETGDSDKSMGIVDLKKSMDALSKDVVGKVGDLVKAQLGEVMSKVDNLAKEVEEIKNTKISKRPASAVVVEKEFAKNDSGVSKSIDEAKAYLMEVEKEIDAHAINMNAVLSVEPHRQAEMLTKSNELTTKLFNAKEKLREAMRA